MAYSSPIAFQGSRCRRAERSRQSATPRLRHLSTVSALMPYDWATVPLGSVDRAISARAAGVVWAFGDVQHRPPLP